MKALSLTQPYATLVVTGEKKIETRSWLTHYRGEIAIHAAKGFPKWAKDKSAGRYFVDALRRINNSDVGFTRWIDNLPFGAIVGTVEIFGVMETENIVSDYEYDIKLFNQMSLEKFTEKERAFGDYSFEPKKRFGWFLRNPRMLIKPIPCKGALSLWEVPQEIEAQLNSEVKA
jgi:hypothetical protein